MRNDKLSVWIRRRKDSTETYHNHKDGLERSADEHENAGAEHEGGSNLLDESQTRFPEQREGDQDEIDIGRDVCGKGGPNDGPRHSSLAEVTRVWVDLPVLVERPAGEENGCDGGDVASDDKGKSEMDAEAIPATEAILPASESLRPDNLLVPSEEKGEHTVSRR